MKMMNFNSVRDKVAIVTGASRGIGRATANIVSTLCDAFAFAGSLAFAHFFHRWIEQPAATLARRLHRPAAAHGAAGYETPLWQGR